MRRFLTGNLLGIRVIGAYKIVSGAVFFAVGVEIFRHLDMDVADWLLKRVTSFRLDPHNRLIHLAIARASRVDLRYLEALGVGTLVYAILHLIEGVGLFLRRRWAGYLTVIATSLLIPVEMYEVARRADSLRVAVILVNMGIVLYLVVRLRCENWNVCEPLVRAADADQVARSNEPPIDARS